MLRGTLNILKEEIPFVYDTDIQTFLNVTEQDLQDLADAINDPWSQTCEKYHITINCKDAYTPIEEGTPIWKCEYHVLTNGYISASIYGYGSTEEEALKDCKDFFLLLQETYNIDND